MEATGQTSSASVLSTNATLTAQEGDQSTEVSSQNLQDIEFGNEKDNNGNSQGKESGEETRSIQGWRWFAVCLSVYSTAILYGLDTTIAANIQANAVETFGAVEKLAWLGTGFSLGSIAIIMFVGKAFGVFNLRTLYLSCLVMFEAGSALCGGSPNMNALICGRIWAGMGGAGIYLGALNTVAIFTTTKERSIYMGMIALFWGIGCILGPVIGGAFADSSATWRWAFYINLVICGAISPSYFFMPSFDPQPNKSLKEKLRHMDWVGAILNAALYVTFVIALTFGGTSWNWSSGGVIGTLVAFGVILIAFSLQQTFAIFTTKEDRLFPIDFLKNRTMVLLYVLTACCATGLFVSIYYVPLYFQFAHGVNGITSAVRLLPFICVLVFSVMVNGIFMPIAGWYMPWYVFSCVLITIGSALMYALMDSHTTNGVIYGLSVVLALGTGSACQAAYSIAPAKVEPIRTPDAVGFINSAQIGSITLALAISGTIFQNIGYQNIADAVAGLGFGPSDIHAAIAGAQSAVLTETTPEVQAAVITGIVNAIRDVYIMSIAGGALGIVAAVLLPREKLYMEMGAGG